jgi:hypothetical protein
MKRSFNAKRLYKFLGVLVVLLTLYFAFLSISMYYYAWGHGDSMNYQVDFRDSNPNGCDYIKYGITTHYNDCHYVYTITKAYNVNRFNLFLTITILLPLIFFGGTWLYKYVFPVKGG